MSQIQISHPHSLTQDQAFLRLQSLASDLSRSYGLSSQTHGYTLHLKRTGASGSAYASPHHISVDISLSWFANSYRDNIEDAVRRLLKTYF